VELKPGYKHTEIGMIPEDWVTTPVHEFGTIKTGPFGTLLKASEYSETDGVPLISVGEIREGFLALTDDTPRVSEAVTRRLPQYVLRNGDIVFGRKGGVDRSALIREGQAGWFLGSDGISIRPSRSDNDEYVSFQFRSSRVQRWLLQNAIGTTMPSLNQEILRRVAIPFPPTRSEQESIARVLSDTDALVESFGQLVAKKRELKQGAMQELLSGKRRLSGFSTSSSYELREVGRIPKDWEVKRLGEIGESLIGLTFKPADVRPDGVLVLRSSNIQEGDLRFEDNVFVQPEIVPERIMVRKGDILICVRNGSRDLIGKCTKIDSRADGMTFGAFMAVFRSPFHAFVYHQFKSDLLKRQIHDHLGATINQITNKSLNSFAIAIPSSKTEQETIADVLNDMDAEIAELEGKLAKARAIKQGVMQELLTGRIRLV
jgi:type I restriction enzyme S subunit